MKARPLVIIFVLALIAAATLLVVRHAGRIDFSEPRALMSARFSRRTAADSASANATIPMTRLESNLFRRLEELEVRVGDVATRHLLEDTLREIEVAVPRGRPIEWVVWHLSQSTDGTSYRVKDCTIDRNSERCRIVFESSNSREITTVLGLSQADRYLSTSASLAILIAGFDFGADKTTMQILSFPQPLTLSLVADRSKSGWTAQAATQYKKEIVIAVPLESRTLSAKQAPASMILVHHPEDRIKHTISEFVKIIPQFSGFCNLYGSRACEDSRVMRIVLEETAKRHAYFVDTKEARNSVVPRIARQMEVPYAEVMATVDDRLPATDIEEHLRHFCVVAHKRGRMLVMAPPTEPFITALTTVLPVLRQNGIRLAYVSEVVNQPGSR